MSVESVAAFTCVVQNIDYVWLLCTGPTNQGLPSAKHRDTARRSCDRSSTVFEGGSTSNWLACKCFLTEVGPSRHITFTCGEKALGAPFACFCERWRCQLLVSLQVVRGDCLKLDTVDLALCLRCPIPHNVFIRLFSNPNLSKRSEMCLHGNPSISNCPQLYDTSFRRTANVLFFS